MSKTPHDVLIEAYKHLHYHEGRTSGGIWNNTTKFGKRYGWNGVAWCQIYVWCIFQDADAGSLVPKTAGCQQAWDWFHARKRTGSTPRAAALIYFGPGRHVGIVKSYTGSTVTYISGNTNDHPGGPANSVEEHTVSRSAPHGYAYPAYEGSSRPSSPAPRPPAGGGPSWPGRLITQPPIMSGGDVRTWQEQMRRRGWSIAVDGRYGPDSEAICRAFQREKGLEVDGIVGPRAWAAAWTAPIT